LFRSPSASAAANKDSSTAAGVQSNGPTIADLLEELPLAAMRLRGRVVASQIRRHSGGHVVDGHDVSNIRVGKLPGGWSSSLNHGHFRRGMACPKGLIEMLQLDDAVVLVSANVNILRHIEHERLLLSGSA